MKKRDKKNKNKSYSVGEYTKKDKELQQLQRELIIRNKIANIFLTIPNDKMYGEVLQVVLEALESKHGVFGYINENGDLVCPYMIGALWDQSQIPNEEIIFAQDAWAGIWQRVLEEKKTLFENKPFKVLEGHAPLHRILAVPIIFRKKGIGSILIANKDADYDDEDKKLLENIANHIAPVLHERLHTGRIEAKQKQVEQAHRESEEKYRSLCDQSMVGIFILQDGRVAYANKGLSNITEYSNEEIINWGFEEFSKVIHPDDQPFVIEQGRKKQLGEKDVTAYYSYRLITKSGKVKVVEIFSQTMVYDSKPAVQGIMADITERKQAEEMIQEREKKFRTLFEDSPASITLVDSSGKIIDCNKFTERLIGYSKEEIIDKTFEKLMTLNPKDLPELKRDFQRLLKGEIVEPFELEIIRKDGKRRWIRVRNSLLIKSDMIVGFQVISTDITDQKRAEEELRDSEEKYRELVDTSIDGVISIDSAMKIVLWNPGARKIFGYAKDEVFGRSVMKIIPEQYRKVMKDSFAGFRKTGIGKLMGKTFEVEGLRKDAAKFPIELSISTKKSGKSIHATAIVRDITERKQAERALRKSEKNYRTLVEQSLQGILIMQDEKIIFVNSAFIKISKYTYDELLALKPKQVKALVHPEDREWVWARLVNLCSGEQVPSRYEFRGLRKDGAVIWLELFGKLIKYKGRPSVQIAVVDITNRKEAEKALRESEEKYRYLFENATDAIYAVDIKGNFISGNKIAEMISGYQREELIGKKFLTIVFEEDKQKVIEGFNKTLSGQRHSYELRIKRKDGEIRTLSVNAAPIIKDGEIVGGQGIARDITEREELEKKLKESEEKFKGIFEFANDSIVIIDKNGFITLANPTFFELTGYTFEEVKDLPISQFIHPEDKDDFMLYFRQVIANQIDYQRFEARAIIKDGSIRYVDISPNIIKKGEETIGIQAVIRDITEKKKLEEKLKENYKELIKTISAFIEVKDLYTEEHSRRIVKDSIYLAQKMNMSEEEIKDIEIAALLHDLGKIKIPGKILNKPGKLNKREEQIMKRHCQLGEEAIMKMPEFRNASQFIRYHHERYDGKGYPDGVKGKKIPLGARIIALVDAFDAMQSNRPYRRALSYEEAKVELIRERGKQFDPNIIDVYLEYLKIQNGNS